MTIDKRIRAAAHRTGQEASLDLQAAARDTIASGRRRRLVRRVQVAAAAVLAVVLIGIPLILSVARREATSGLVGRPRASVVTMPYPDAGAIDGTNGRDGVSDRRGVRGEGVDSGTGVPDTDAEDAANLSVDGMLLFVDSAVPNANGDRNQVTSTECGARPAAKIYTMALDGSKRTLIADGDSPRWSPDKQKIVFERAVHRDATNKGTCASEIWEMNADGSRQRKLRSTGTDPAWSPNGNRIAFTQQPKDEPQSFPQIWVMDADGGNAQVVRPKGNHHWPDWSPDGRKIVFSRLAWDADVLWDGEPPPDELNIYDLADGIEWRVFTGGGIETPSEPAWSPDGRHVAFESDAGKGAIYVIGADGSGLRKLTSGSDDSSPAWSPDGRHLVFRRGGDVYVMKNDGTGVRRIGPGSEPDL